MFSVHLLATKVQLGETRTRIYKQLMDEHVTDKIKQNQQMTEELTRSLDIKLGRCEPGGNVSLIVNGELVWLSVYSMSVL